MPECAGAPTLEPGAAIQVSRATGVSHQAERPGSLLGSLQLAAALTKLTNRRPRSTVSFLF
jgi:hypothetical protein